MKRLARTYYLKDGIEVTELGYNHKPKPGDAYVFCTIEEKAKEKKKKAVKDSNLWLLTFVGNNTITLVDPNTEETYVGTPEMLQKRKFWDTSEETGERISEDLGDLVPVKLPNNKRINTINQILERVPLKSKNNIPTSSKFEARTFFLKDDGEATELDYNHNPKPGDAYVLHTVEYAGRGKNNKRIEENQLLFLTFVGEKTIDLVNPYNETTFKGTPEMLQKRKIWEADEAGKRISDDLGDLVPVKIRNKKKTVNTLEEILENIKTIARYLNDADMKDYAISLIKKGTCFLVIKKDDGYQFYPSRFIGYLNNSMGDHENNYDKDGRITNKAIKEILGHNPKNIPELENEYYKYCEKLGFNAYKTGTFGVQRKYWLI